MIVFPKTLSGSKVCASILVLAKADVRALSYQRTVPFVGGTYLILVAPI
jgi:hypothetical protein